MVIDNFNALTSPISENTPLAYTGARSGADSAAFHRVSETSAFTVLYQPGAFSIYASSNGLQLAGRGLPPGCRRLEPLTGSWPRPAPSREETEKTRQRVGKGAEVLRHERK
jgi:hypothetical protein